MAIWTEISQRYDLNFIELPETCGEVALEANRNAARSRSACIAAWCARSRPGAHGTVVYGRADMPDDFAYIVAKALDEQQHLLQWKH